MNSSPLIKQNGKSLEASYVKIQAEVSSKIKNKNLIYNISNYTILDHIGRQINKPIVDKRSSSIAINTLGGYSNDRLVKDKNQNATTCEIRLDNLGSNNIKLSGGGTPKDGDEKAMLEENRTKSFTLKNAPEPTESPSSDEYYNKCHSNENECPPQ